MNSDLTFITNEENQTLKERFEVLIKDTSLFDCLVGYFYSSGFHAIYHSLEDTEKIRILIGISTSRQTFELLENANLFEYNAQADKPKQQQIDFSHAEAKQEVENLVQKEMENSENNGKVEEGKFNKQYGVYYTPREIVHYMCQQLMASALRLAWFMDVCRRGPILENFPFLPSHHPTKVSLEK